MSRLHPDLALGLCLRALGLITINHACLGDYDQPGWFAVKLVTILLGMLLVFTPQKQSTEFGFDHFKLSAVIAGLLCLAKLYTLLFLRDVLTQSLLLTMYFLTISCSARKAKERNSILLCLSTLSASTYLLAIVHKLNYDFLYTAQSCAIHGYDLSLSLIPQFLMSSLHKSQLIRLLNTYPLLASISVLSLEWLLALLCWQRHKLIWLIGLIFHLPLTLTIAPSFGAVMALGWGAGTMLGSRNTKYNKRQTVKLKLILKHKLIVFIYVSHGLLSPYLGIEVQHSAAMLSNLRIDPACANSLIFPPIGHDPYVYIHKAHFGQNKRPKRLKKLQAGLWSLSALKTMQKNWCIKEQRPLKLKGTYAHQPFEIADLCAKEALYQLYERSHLPTFGAWQRFQKNLQKTCHQSCVH